ncbi:MAG: GNAT family N-acetyltransferase [Bacillati bacterium ANGP1]|uniref:GNAT family N-acetyltransferase n=1 Tax=Candidatus Segetimicrobium genomatis TaxID=2569760 RepID=A0A537J7M6_9BACT|nr:MAG: GNAT family N-acetyltransferase [Terrabacteria group bacterium ANGP1]
MNYRIRRAIEEDLRPIYDVWCAAALRGRSPTPWAVMASLFRHEMATGEMWVAEGANGLVGFAALMVRGDVAFLGELFVLPDVQSRGIGRALLRQVLAAPADIYCTMSSGDPRAMALYIGAGMTPQWPHFLLTAAVFEERLLPGSDVTVAVAAPGDLELVAWDTRVGGRHRPQDHDYWQRGIGAAALWFKRAGAVCGCGYVSQRPADAARPAAAGVGPLGALSADDAPACVGAAVRWARDAGAAASSVIYIAVPGQHGALSSLLRAGFQIREVETFCCSRSPEFFDPRTYLAAAAPEGTSLF